MKISMQQSNQIGYSTLMLLVLLGLLILFGTFVIGPVVGFIK